jgi:hypothetical protein
VALEGNDVLAIAERVSSRLARGPWDTAALETAESEPAADAELETAAEVAVFALELAGKRRQARRGGRFGKLIVTFALAACVALSGFTAACDKPDATAEATQTAINALASTSGSAASITAPARASPANFTDMVLLDAGTDASPWAVLQANGSAAPILVDRVGAGLDSVGATYSLAAQPITVGTRDGVSQFLDPLQPATQTSDSTQSVSSTATQLEQRWSQDERYLAPTRAISGQTTVLDAAYNAAAAAAAGGTHTYLNGVVLRAEPDKPVLSVIDKALLESGAPTRQEDVVYVAIPSSQQASYDPGQVVNLRDVVMSQQQTDVNGQQTTLYTVNAAVDGAHVEPTGNVNLQSLLQPRLQRVDQDIAASDQAAASPTSATPGPTSTPGPTHAPQQVIVRDRGPSFVDDFLIWMWLTNSGFYRGPSVIINNPPSSPSRPSGSTYYAPPPAPSGSTPSTVASSQAASRSTAIEASRSAVSGQSSGTGGGVAATNKTAGAAAVAAGAATAKSASVASDVSAASTGKSAASVASGTGSSTASRSAGSTSAGTRGTAGSSSSSSGSKGIGSSSSGGRGSSSSSGSSGGFGSSGSGSSSSGGKGISGSSSS